MVFKLVLNEVNGKTLDHDDSSVKHKKFLLARFFTIRYIVYGKY
ncbi:hypothetical protein BDCR2A_00008 [Borrelia duttonii CR2A]|uniref:Uncharacterized protein n=1 Tax=Borrelia duttonii CR2A TaxID=1432657 RepID=W6THM6_9SPIR|nr:hypothetical protein [Borrelia duttonii]ETZ17316.1 hypothetical protein BDCR2A_01764 [Borrelia duttonii CR2A]ETZ18035.1 hypothetical protein BDCR2A_00008 [Borrelia duttonii CR2A]